VLTACRSAADLNSKKQINKIKSYREEDPFLFVSKKYTRHPSANDIQSDTRLDPTKDVKSSYKLVKKRLKTGLTAII
jgi:hypothetical protein